MAADSTEVFLADDQLESKRPAFDPARVDRRPVEGSQVNASDAVIKLDTSRPADKRGGKELLAASYAAGLTSVDPSAHLPSINVIDGKAKQVDDGLYAALDRAYYRGDPALGAGVVGHRDWLVRLVRAVPADSAASDYLLVQFGPSVLVE